MIWDNIVASNVFVLKAILIPSKYYDIKDKGLTCFRFLLIVVYFRIHVPPEFVIYFYIRRGHFDRKTRPCLSLLVCEWVHIQICDPLCQRTKNNVGVSKTLFDHYFFTASSKR